MHTWLRKFLEAVVPGLKEKRLLAKLKELESALAATEEARKKAEEAMNKERAARKKAEAELWEKKRQEEEKQRAEEERLRKRQEEAVENFETLGKRLPAVTVEELDDIFKNLPQNYWWKIEKYKNELYCSSKFSLANALFYRAIKEASPDVSNRIADEIIARYPTAKDMSHELYEGLFQGFRHSDLQLLGRLFNDDKILSNGPKALDNLPAVEKHLSVLMKMSDFVVSKAIENQSIGSASGLINTFMGLNLRRLYNHQDCQSSLVMPANFHNPDWIELLKKENADMNSIYLSPLLAFCQSENFEQWFENAYLLNGKNPLPIRGAKQKYWNAALVNASEDMKSHILPSDSDTCVALVQKYEKMAKENPKGVAEGIFVDIDDTLIPRDEYYAPNKKLYDFLIKLLDAGEKVTIFTGGDVRSQKERLKEAFGPSVERFSVVSKNDYRGFLFTGCIIDDTRPEIQGFIMQDPKNYFQSYWTIERYVQLINEISIYSDAYRNLKVTLADFKKLLNVPASELRSKLAHDYLAEKNHTRRHEINEFDKKECGIAKWYLPKGQRDY